MSQLAVHIHITLTMHVPNELSCAVLISNMPQMSVSNALGRGDSSVGSGASFETNVRYRQWFRTSMFARDSFPESTFVKTPPCTSMRTIQILKSQQKVKALEKTNPSIEENNRKMGSAVLSLHAITRNNIPNFFEEQKNKYVPNTNVPNTKQPVSRAFHRSRRSCSRRSTRQTSCRSTTRRLTRTAHSTSWVRWSGTSPTS